MSDLKPLQNFSIEELGEILPDYIEIIKKNEEGSLWWCGIDNILIGIKPDGYKWVWGDTIKEAMLKMAIHLISNGHISPVGVSTEIQLEKECTD